MRTYPWRSVLAEFIGTFSLVMVGCGAITVKDQTGVLTHSGVAMAFDLVVMVMVSAVGHISGAHPNPAVTLAFAVSRHFPWRLTTGYFIAQFSGAAVAAVLLRILFGVNTELGVTLPSGSLAALQEFANGLQAEGKTAIYDSLRTAYEQALADQQAEPDRYYTIVLMSDGENNTGQSLENFLNFYHSQPGAENIKTFAILFGEVDEKEMTELVEATGGRLFNAKETPLETIFKQIRGYQ